MHSLALSLLLLSTVGLGASPTASAQESGLAAKPQTADGRYGREKEGWFFYRDPPTPAPLKDPLPTPAKPKAQDAKKVLSAEWIRENLPKYRNAAIDNPTKDNIELYLYLQKLAMDKAEQFALASRKYAAMNPTIDETVQNPTSGIARSAASREIEDQQDKLIAHIRQRAGIYYFFRSDCPYCHKQNPMLDVLKRMTGMTIMPISLDGLPSEDGALPDWRPDRGQGSYLGVEKTPTMYLVEPGGQVLLLSVGVRSLPEIKERIIELAMDNSWITRDEYNIAMSGLPRKYLTDGLADTNLADDPSKLLSVLRDASRHGKLESSFDEMDNAEATPWKPTRN